MLNKAVTSAQGAVRGPYGNLLALEDLPRPNTHRWVVRRKAEVLAAIIGGLLSLEQACDRYKLSVEELTAWQTALHQYGLLGLRTSRLQHYRAKTRFYGTQHLGSCLDTSRGGRTGGNES
jgi:hypothetical protein